MESQALVQNDAVVLGILALMIGFVFYTEASPHPFWRKFYKYVPGILLCYVLPSLLNSFGIVDPAKSQINPVASRYLLPATLVLLTISVDFKGIVGLGYKAVLLFLTGTVGVVLGGPLAFFLVGLVSPESVGGTGADAVWRGLSTLSGSWIGGAANQMALKEIFRPSDAIFSQVVAVDIMVQSTWMALLLYLAGESKVIDAKTGADTRALDELRRRVEAFHDEHAKYLTTRDVIFIIAVGFGVTGISQGLGDWIATWIGQNAPGLARLSLTSPFFWLVCIATAIGIGLSFTPVKRLEGAGASRIGTGMLYILVASIGMGMDVTAMVKNPGLFAVGFVWMAFHATLMFTVARLVRAPLFYMCVGSQANIGGAATAPVLASAFHPSLAPAGVLLAVLGYAVGTYAGWLSGLMLQALAN
ncbi:MAG: DUF819 family protein [Gemmatimonadetes bacterium]|nr:DUF819 family protein [Gemmatimonadota bacterium]